MPPQRDTQRTYNEITLILAIQATQDTVPDMSVFEIPFPPVLG